MLRSVLDYRRLVAWEYDVLNRGVRKESWLSKAVQRIPWSGVSMFAFVMIFMGIDLFAGVKYTAQQMREKKEEAANMTEVKKMQARSWSVEQVKSFRDGETAIKRETLADADLPMAEMSRPSHQGGAVKRNQVF